MAERSRPWSGIVTGDAGPYSDDQWTDSWASLLGPIIASEGVFRRQTNELNVTGAVSPVSVNTGRALVDGTWYESDVAVAVSVLSPAANPRIDRIVLRKDWALQTVRITRIAGAEGAAPVPPALVQNDGVTWDTPLFQVRIIVAGTITIYADERDFIGQYEPATYVRDDEVYFEDDFFDGVSPWVNNEARRMWQVEDATGGQILSSTPAGFGAGAVTLSYPAATPAAGVALHSLNHMPDVINARTTIRAFEVATDANLDRYLGYVSAVGNIIPNDGVYFRSVGAGNWFAVTRTGAAETVTDTGQAPTAAWKKWEMKQRGSSVVEFWLDDVLVAVHTTNIPVAVALEFALGLIDSGAPAAQVYQRIDYVKGFGDR